MVVPYPPVVFAIFCCVLYNRPLALLGLIVTVKMWDWVRSGGESDVNGSSRCGPG